MCSMGCRRRGVIRARQWTRWTRWTRLHRRLSIQSGHLQLLNDIGGDLRNNLWRQIRRSLCITKRRVDCVVDPPSMRLLWLLLLLLPLTVSVIWLWIWLWILARRRRSRWGHRRRGHHLRWLHLWWVHLRWWLLLLLLWYTKSIGPIRRIGTTVVIVHSAYMVWVVVWAAVVRIVIVCHEAFFLFFFSFSQQIETES